MSDVTTFKRREIKYLLSSEEYEGVKKYIGDRLVEDEHGKSTICNIYYDTPDYRIIRKSLEKPVYKEKLRVRSYGAANPDDKVFVEIKKKYKGIVYKRREALTLRQSDGYLKRKENAPRDSQIFHEIDWFLNYYNGLAPAMYISYEREAYYSRQNPDLRITFDSNICYRSQNLNLSGRTDGDKILTDGQRLMEVKAGGAIPMWLADALDELKIFPTSFSKYGRAYMNMA